MTSILPNANKLVIIRDFVCLLIKSMLYCMQQLVSLRKDGPRSYGRPQIIINIIFSSLPFENIKRSIKNAAIAKFSHGTRSL